MPGEVPGLTSICAIAEPLEALAPEIPPETAPTVHVKVAPAILLVRAIFVVLALQITRGLAVETVGVGFTVIVNDSSGPSHVAVAFAK